MLPPSPYRNEPSSSVCPDVRAWAASVYDPTIGAVAAGSKTVSLRLTDPERGRPSVASALLGFVPPQKLNPVQLARLALRAYFSAARSSEHRISQPDQSRTSRRPHLTRIWLPHQDPRSALSFLHRRPDRLHTRRPVHPMHDIRRTVARRGRRRPGGDIRRECFFQSFLYRHGLLFGPRSDRRPRRAKEGRAHLIESSGRIAA